MINHPLYLTVAKHHAWMTLGAVLGIIIIGSLYDTPPLFGCLSFSVIIELYLFKVFPLLGLAFAWLMFLILSGAYGVVFVMVLSTFGYSLTVPGLDRDSFMRAHACLWWFIGLVVAPAEFFLFLLIGYIMADPLGYVNGPAWWTHPRPFPYWVYRLSADMDVDWSGLLTDGAWLIAAVACLIIRGGKFVIVLLGKAAASVAWSLAQVVDGKAREWGTGARRRLTTMMTPAKPQVPPGYQFQTRPPLYRYPSDSSIGDFVYSAASSGWSSPVYAAGSGLAPRFESPSWFPSVRNVARSCQSSLEYLLEKRDREVAEIRARFLEDWEKRREYFGYDASPPHMSPVWVPFQDQCPVSKYPLPASQDSTSGSWYAQQVAQQMAQQAQQLTPVPGPAREPEPEPARAPQKSALPQQSMQQQEFRPSVSGFSHNGFRPTARLLFPAGQIPAPQTSAPKVQSPPTQVPQVQEPLVQQQSLPVEMDLDDRQDTDMVMDVVMDVVMDTTPAEDPDVSVLSDRLEEVASDVVATMDTSESTERQSSRVQTRLRYGFSVHAPAPTPTPAPAPVAAPVATPVATPVAVPVAAPVRSPAAPPSQFSFAAGPAWPGARAPAVSRPSPFRPRTPRSRTPVPRTPEPSTPQPGSPLSLPPLPPPPPPPRDESPSAAFDSYRPSPAPSFSPDPWSSDEAEVLEDVPMTVGAAGPQPGSSPPPMASDSHRPSPTTSRISLGWSPSDDEGQVFENVAIQAVGVEGPSGSAAASSSAPVPAPSPVPAPAPVPTPAVPARIPGLTLPPVVLSSSGLVMPPRMPGLTLPPVAPSSAPAAPSPVAERTGPVAAQPTETESGGTSRNGPSAGPLLVRERPRTTIAEPSAASNLVNAMVRQKEAMYQSYVDEGINPERARRMVEDEFA